jgi:hypothetical protein
MLEAKIARVMHEVSSGKMKVYQMTPAYYGAALIAVTTGKELLEIVKKDGENVEDYMDALTGNEDRVLLLPGFDLGLGVAIAKGMGHFVDGTAEQEFEDNGYVVLDLGDE